MRVCVGFNENKAVSFNIVVKILSAILFFTLSSSAVCQTYSDSLFLSLYDQKAFDEIIASTNLYHDDSLSALSHYIVGLAYLSKDNIEDALTEFYESKSRDAHKTQFYAALLYKIGYFEKEIGHHVQSNDAFAELIRQDSTDYLVATFIIQNFFAMNNNEAAMPFQELLYRAYEANKLPDELRPEYCYDRFKVGDKTVVACENYARLGSPETSASFSKQRFYVYSEDDNLLFTLETVKIHQLTPSDQKYVLNQRFWEPGGLRTSQSYWSYTFTDPVDYRELKKAVITVLLGGARPDAESKFKRE